MSESYTTLEPFSTIDEYADWLFEQKENPRAKNHQDSYHFIPRAYFNNFAGLGNGQLIKVLRHGAENIGYCCRVGKEDDDFTVSVERSGYRLYDNSTEYMLSIAEGHFCEIVRDNLLPQLQDYFSGFKKPKPNGSILIHEEPSKNRDQKELFEVTLDQKVRLSTYFALQSVRYPEIRNLKKDVRKNARPRQVMILKEDVIKQAKEVFDFDFGVFTSSLTQLGFRERIFTNLSIDLDDGSLVSSMTIVFPLSPDYGIVWYRDDNGKATETIANLAESGKLTIACNSLNFPHEVLYFQHENGNFKKAIKSVMVYSRNAKLISDHFRLVECSQKPPRKNTSAYTKVDGSRARERIDEAFKCQSETKCLMSHFHPNACGFQYLID